MGSVREVMEDDCCLPTSSVRFADTFSRSLNRRLWHYRAKSSFRFPLPFANAFGVVPTGHSLISSASRGRRRGLRIGRGAFSALPEGGMNAAPTINLCRGGIHPARMFLVSSSRIEGDIAQASRGNCICPGGLRCSLKHTKPAPDRVLRGQSGVQGLSPCCCGAGCFLPALSDRFPCCAQCACASTAGSLPNPSFPPD